MIVGHCHYRALLGTCFVGRTEERNVPRRHLCPLEGWSNIESVQQIDVMSKVAASLCND